MSREMWVAWQVDAVGALIGLVGVVLACALVGLSRATHHRIVRPKPKEHGPREAPRPHPAALSPAERVEVLALLNSDRYANISVAQVYARELDEGRYWCSPRTMHRILADADQSGERRRQATHPARTIPELVAHTVGEVWAWDITKMRGLGKGCWFHAYVILDIFSATSWAGGSSTSKTDAWPVTWSNRSSPIPGIDPDGYTPTAARR